jgi:hypothetical protein
MTGSARSQPLSEGKPRSFLVRKLGVGKTTQLLLRNAFLDASSGGRASRQLENLRRSICNLLKSDGGRP